MSKKVLYIIAGANGSGKTSFAKTYAEINKFHFINADEIAKQYDPNDIQKHKIKAGREFFRQLNEYIYEKEESFIIETTLSGKYLIDIIRQAKDNNLEIVLIYLFLETQEEHIFRVRHRVLNGGHDVPVEDIIRRYKRSRKLFWNVYKNLVDNWIVFYNGDDGYELVANEKEIFQEEFYNLFLKETQ